MFRYCSRDGEAYSSWDIGIGASGLQAKGLSVGDFKHTSYTSRVPIVSVLVPVLV